MRRVFWQSLQHTWLEEREDDETPQTAILFLFEVLRARATRASTPVDYFGSRISKTGKVTLEISLISVLRPPFRIQCEWVLVVLMVFGRVLIIAASTFPVAPKANR